MGGKGASDFVIGREAGGEAGAVLDEEASKPVAHEGPEVIAAGALLSVRNRAGG
jgi:hypothetical protein